jgi:hypothetical protein
MSRLRGFLRRLRAARGARSEDKPSAPGAAPRVAAASAVDTTPSRLRVNQWRDWLQRTLATDGYLVQGCSEEMSAGARVRVWGTDRLFEVLGPASHEEALRQWRVYER